MTSYCSYYSMNGEAPTEVLVDQMILALEEKSGKNHVAERIYWFECYDYRDNLDKFCFSIYRDYEEKLK